MSDREDIYWSLQRQSRALQDALADARLVWRDANARDAEMRFLQPRAEAEATVVTAVAAQHRELNSVGADLRRADEQQQEASAASLQVAQECDHAVEEARLAASEAALARSQALEADEIAATARNYVVQANAAGS